MCTTSAGLTNLFVSRNSAMRMRTSSRSMMDRPVAAATRTSAVPGRRGPPPRRGSTVMCSVSASMSSSSKYLQQ
jgi:hypothetical protein